MEGLPLLRAGFDKKKEGYSGIDRRNKQTNKNDRPLYKNLVLLFRSCLTASKLGLSNPLVFRGNSQHHPFPLHDLLERLAHRNECVGRDYQGIRYLNSEVTSLTRRRPTRCGLFQ